jgi:hypothetical protein
MAGRPKMKMYEYDQNGRFVCEYPTQYEVFVKYYEGKKRPLIRKGEQYAILPNGHFIANYRIGRERLMYYEKAKASKYVSTAGEIRKNVVAYNLLGERVATFRSVHMAALITGIGRSTIVAALRPSSKRKTTKSLDLLFRYEE